MKMTQNHVPQPFPVNPYAPPETAEITAVKPASSITSSRKLLSLRIVFAVLRAVASGFATLILLVHLSGTPIHWENVIPMLTVAVVVCLVLHWGEWRFRFQRTVTLILGFVGYVAGIGVVTIAGMLNYFPNPF